MEVFPLISVCRRIRRTTSPARPARLTLIAGTALLGAALTACSGAAASDSGSGSDDGAGAARTPDTRITVNLQGTKAAAGKPVTVTLADGQADDGEGDRRRG